MDNDDYTIYLFCCLSIIIISILTSILIFYLNKNANVNANVQINNNANVQINNIGRYGTYINLLNQVQPINTLPITINAKIINASYNLKCPYKCVGMFVINGIIHDNNGDTELNNIITEQFEASGSGIYNITLTNATSQQITDAENNKP